MKMRIRWDMRWNENMNWYENEMIEGELMIK